jgi:hypothetical protein
MSSNIEIPISGHPWVLLQLDKDRYSVSVEAHCKKWSIATALVDMMTEEPNRVEYMIVRDKDLVQELRLQRRLMADRMEIGSGA